MKPLMLALMLTASVMTVPAAARMLDPTNPQDAVEITRRAQCGIGDKPAVYHWSGRIYSRVAGEPDRHLFNGEGMNIRRCVSVKDPRRGEGFRLVSREIMLFTDPKTGEIVRTWQNPWTGETVPVMHIANDPVNQRPMFPYGPDGKPVSLRYEQVGPWFQMPLEVPLFYDNPLAGAYQDYVGNKYHAMEIFDFVAQSSDLLDTRTPTAHPSVSWVRISDWMPWMKMRGREGMLVFNAMGSKVGSIDDLPKVLRDEIAARYPTYVDAPPGDDQRVNETTWTVFQKQVDAERAAARPPK